MVHVEQLVRIPFLQGLAAGTLRRLADAASELTLQQGDYIVHLHDQAQHVFFLGAGVVQIFIRFGGVDDLLVGALRQPGALIGWSVFRKPYRYTASVRCEEPCRVVRIPREILDELIHHEPRLGYLLLRRVAAALADRLEQTRGLLFPAEKASRWTCRISYRWLATPSGDLLRHHTGHASLYGLIYGHRAWRFSGYS